MILSRLVSLRELLVLIGERLRQLRQAKHFTHGDIERKTGVACSHISRVEHGHMVPAVETLEKFARALEIPMYKLFYDGEQPPKLLNLAKHKPVEQVTWAGRAKRHDCSPSSCACSAR